MRNTSAWLVLGWLLAGCGVSVIEQGGGNSPKATQAVELSGARNEAFRAAAQKHQVPVELLMAIAHQQGRFELPTKTQQLMDGVEPEASISTPGMNVPDVSTEQPAEPVAPADSAEDKVVAEAPFDLPADPSDEGLQTSLQTDSLADDPMAVDVATSEAEVKEEGSAHAEKDLYGVMFLTDAQVKVAASLTGLSEFSIRTDVAANVDAAAALLVAYANEMAVDSSSKSLDVWAPAITRLVEADGDTEIAALAMTELKSLYLDGFDLVTHDGERLALQGSGRDVGSMGQELTPGQYPSLQFISAASTNFSNRNGGAVRYIIIHDIEGTMAGAISTFKNPKSSASAHYIIRSSDGKIVQMVPESRKAWHCGHGFFNANSIGIEHEGFANRVNGGGYYTTKLYQASAALTCAIAKKYNIPVDRKHIFGHGNVPSTSAGRTLCSDANANAGRCGGLSHHHDPGKYWDWTAYMKLVARCKNGVAPAPTPKPPPTTPTTTTLKGIIYKGGDTTKPIAGATVRLGTKTVTTDAKGYYEIAGVPAGSRTISASATGYITKAITREVSGKETWGSIGLSVQAPAGSAVLMGIVYKGTSTSNRVASATVKLSNGRTTTTNADGVYQFTGLAPATYTVTATMSGVGSASTSRAVTNGTTTWGSVKL